MKYLNVANWEKHQHYKERTPPWIKLSRDLLNDYSFSCLQDASKLHLMLIWLLASQLDNKIPADSKFIKMRIGVSTDIDLKELVDNGFLVDASGVLAECQQVAMPEGEGETETETETESVCAAKASPKKTGSRFDMGTHVDDSWLKEAKRLKPQLTTQDVRDMLDGFNDHWISKSGKDATKLNWLATWRNWVRGSRQAYKPKEKLTALDQHQQVLEQFKKEGLV